MNTCLLACTDEINNAKELYNTFKKLPKYALFIEGEENQIQEIISDIKYAGYRIESQPYLTDKDSFKEFIQKQRFLTKKIPFEAMSICIIYPLKLSEYEKKKEILTKSLDYILDLEIGFNILFTDENSDKSSNKGNLERHKQIIQFLKKSITNNTKLSRFSDFEDLIISNIDSLKFEIN